MSTDLKELTTDLKARKLAKLAAENTALDGCMEDMSDVNFTIGKGYMSTAALPEAFITVGLIILRMAIRRSATGETVLPGTTWSVFHLLILVSLLLVAIVSIADKLRPYITVVKKKSTTATRSGITTRYSGWNARDSAPSRCM